MKTFFRFLPILFLAVAITACDSNSSNDDENLELNVTTVTELAADPFVGFVNGQPVGSGRYTFYSLRENKVVAAGDSATTKWDIALRGTTLLVNGGTSGPGVGQAQVVEGLFEELVEAPVGGWKADAAGSPAITVGSGKGWYNYSPSTMTITPIPGRVIFVQTANGKYAKVRILNYYKGQPATPTQDSLARYFTFEYVIQPDGSRELL